MNNGSKSNKNSDDCEDTDVNLDDKLSDHTIERLEEIGSRKPPSYSKLVPVENSSKKGLAGTGGNVKPTYVGHVAYCEDLECFVYQVQKERSHLLDSVRGKGVAISKKIINSLQNEYDADYVFVGIRETGNVLMMPVDDFDKEWHTENYDEQYYARLDEDAENEIRGKMSDIFCKHPSKSSRSIRKEDALERMEK